jgi:hypothetical protein
MDLAPSTNVTFTITSLPKSERGKKTLRRVMKMQPDVQRVLTKLARLRDQVGNRRTNRAGRIWIDRRKPTQVVRLEVGQTFTLRVTPQIIPDLQSLAKHLDAKAA